MDKETIELRFCDNSSVKNCLPSKEDKELFILAPSTVEDAGYKCRFNVYYYDKENDKHIHIGMIKFCVPLESNKDTNLCQQVMNTKEDIIQGKYNDNTDLFSIGANYYFYYNLHKKLNSYDLAKKFLIKINDINTIKDIQTKGINAIYLDKSDPTEKLQIKCIDNPRLNLIKLAKSSTFSEQAKLIYSIDHSTDALNDKKYLDYFYQTYIKHEDKNEKNRLYLSLIFVNALKNNIKSTLNPDLISDLLELLTDYSGNRNLEEDIGNILGAEDTNTELTGDLKSIFQTIEKIRKTLALTSSDNNIKLYQYTPASSIQYLLKPNGNVKNERKTQDENQPVSLRFTNANQMNDPIEGKLLVKALGLPEDTGYKLSNFYISSATSAEDSLPLWKQYADEGKGICLEYDPQYLKQILDDKVHVNIFRECYIDINPDKEKQDWDKDTKINIKVSTSGQDDMSSAQNKEIQIENYLKNIYQKIKELKIKNKDEKKDNISSIVKNIKIFLNSNIGYLFKRMDYSYENEFRLSLNMEGRENQLYYQFSQDGTSVKLHAYMTNDDEQRIPVKYNKVILGPKAEDIDYIAPYIELCDKNIKVETSKIKYR